MSLFVQKSTQTPVCIIVFNRPDLTVGLLQALRAVKPSRVLVVSDGPRTDRIGEAELVESVRMAVDREIDWACVVEKNYSDVNLGCGRRVSTGLNWLFERVESAIILEDDCLPNVSFFRFAAEMLRRYENNPKIMHVNGSSLLAFPRNEMDGNYYYSTHPWIWGWATWRRAWKHYDFEAKAWKDPEFRRAVEVARERFGDFDHWDRAFTSVAERKIDTWDYQWVLSCWLNSGLAVTPKRNLISNKGFRSDATHTRAQGPLCDIPSAELREPYRSPATLAPNVRRDKCFSMIYHPEQKLFARVIGKAGRLLTRFGRP